MPWIPHDLQRTPTLLLLAACVFLGAVPMWAQQNPGAPSTGEQPATLSTEPPLTLAAAMLRALELNPSAEAARSGVDMARADLRRLRSTVLPQLNASGSATRHDRSAAFEIEGNTTVVQPRDDWQYSVTLSQPIYAGGRELKAIRQARLGVDSSEAGVRGVEEDLLLGTATSYLAAVQGTALVEVENKSLELAKRRGAQAKDFFDAGETTKVDVLRAETGAKEAERRVARAEAIRDSALSRLRENLALDALPPLAGRGAEPPPLPSEAELLERAARLRPEVQQARFAESIALLEVAKQKGSRLPVVRAEASYREQAAGFPLPSSAGVSLLVDVPIFDSGERSARIAHAQAAADQARYQREQAERAVREDVRRALLDLRTAERGLALAAEQLQAAEAEYAQAFDLYRAQESTALDLEAAENSLADARRAMVVGTLDQDLATLLVWARVSALTDTVRARAAQETQ